MAQILLIDDEINVLKMWKQALRPLQHELVLAHNAKEALSYCDEREFDLVIIDFLMPDRWGIDLLHDIRIKAPQIRSIMISGQLESSMSEEQVKDVLKGRVEVDAYLAKPVSNEVLRQCVEDLLNQEDSEWIEWARQGEQIKKIKGSEVAAATDDLKKHLRKKK